ncbi:MAG: hypothetical protein ABL964_03620, partial [Steroidobacteraceae bacterium]
MPRCVNAEVRFCTSGPDKKKGVFPAFWRQFAPALELLWLFLWRNLLPFVAFAVVSLVWPAGSQ